jgi:uncharacterized protein (DUF849 family)
MAKRIISCSITGSIHSPTMSDYLPWKPKDIARHAIDAANAGAASVHIHARSPVDGSPSSDLDVFDEILTEIRSKNKDVIICVTTGGSFKMTVDERMAVVPRFKPQLCSMNAGSINWGLYALADKYNEWKFPWEQPLYASTKDVIFKNTFADMERMLDIMAENNTKPESECYDTGHLYNVKSLINRGLIKDKPFLQFCLGINGALGADPVDLVVMKQTADRLFGAGGYEWSAFGAGKADYPIGTMNLVLGGHVRVGMEDNLFLGKGKPAKSNAEHVEKIIRIMGEFDFEPASPAEAKQILGIVDKGNF